MFKKTISKIESTLVDKTFNNMYFLKVEGDNITYRSELNNKVYVCSIKEVSNEVLARRLVNLYPNMRINALRWVLKEGKRANSSLFELNSGSLKCRRVWAEMFNKGSLLKLAKEVRS